LNQKCDITDVLCLLVEKANNKYVEKTFDNVAEYLEQRVTQIQFNELVQKLDNYATKQDIEQLKHEKLAASTFKQEILNFITYED